MSHLQFYRAMLARNFIASKLQHATVYISHCNFVAGIDQSAITAFCDKVAQNRAQFYSEKEFHDC